MCRDKQARQIKVIRFKSYCPNTQTHTPADSSTWTTKLVGNNLRNTPLYRSVLTLTGRSTRTSHNRCATCSRSRPNYIPVVCGGKQRKDERLGRRDAWKGRSSLRLNTQIVRRRKDVCQSLPQTSIYSWRVVTLK